MRCQNLSRNAKNLSWDAVEQCCDAVISIKLSLFLFKYTTSSKYFSIEGKGVAV